MQRDLNNTSLTLWTLEVGYIMQSCYKRAKKQMGVAHLRSFMSGDALRACLTLKGCCPAMSEPVMAPYFRP